MPACCSKLVVSVLYGSGEWMQKYVLRCMLNVFGVLLSAAWMPPAAAVHTSFVSNGSTASTTRQGVSRQATSPRPRLRLSPRAELSVPPTCVLSLLDSSTTRLLSLCNTWTHRCRRELLI